MPRIWSGAAAILFAATTTVVAQVPNFSGYWTLEMFAVQPVRIYPGVPICQIFYHELTGEYQEYSSDKYHNNRDIQPSLLYRELNPDAEKADPQLTIDFGQTPRG